MTEDFRSEEELYDRLKPALVTKRAEMKRNGYPYVKEEDVWNYLKEKKWKKLLINVGVLPVDNMNLF